MTIHSEQHLDKLAKKVIKKLPLETPSFDFTATIMAKIEATETSSITTYKPLISKKAWLVISAIVAGLIIYLFSLDGSQTSSGMLDKVDLSMVTDNKLVNTVSSVMMSKILIYAVTLFGAAWFLQITLLKYQLNKRLNY